MRRSDGSLIDWENWCRRTANGGFATVESKGKSVSTELHRPCTLSLISIALYSCIISLLLCRLSLQSACEFFSGAVWIGHPPLYPDGSLSPASLIGQFLCAESIKPLTSSGQSQCCLTLCDLLVSILQPSHHISPLLLLPTCRSHFFHLPSHWVGVPFS